MAQAEATQQHGLTMQFWEYLGSSVVACHIFVQEALAGLHGLLAVSRKSALTEHNAAALHLARFG